MKLKLSQERGIAILEVQEQVSLENVAVLRAGVSKLFSSGKNKIIIHLVDAKSLSMDIVKEIVSFHMVATELKGQIVMVGQGDLMLQAIKSFSVPPPVKFFTAKEAAFAALVDSGNGPQNDQGMTLGSNSELKTQIERLEAENRALKAKLSSRNVEEMRKLRLDNGNLQMQLTSMEDQLRMLLKERRKPFELESLNVRIQQLEMALEGFLQKENLVPKN